MEYIFNHQLSLNDTSGQQDRPLRRPVSAFVPTQSYYADRAQDDDVGRPVVQHRPLAKGEHTQLSLAKQFDDPGMRPKVHCPAEVNKVSYGLESRDVEGAAPRPKDLPKRPRDTDPNTPAYILPGSSAVPPPQQPQQPQQQQGPDAAGAAGSAGAGAGGSAGVGRGSAWADVSDITAVDSVVERPHRLATRSTALDVSDIEGSRPGWEPHFRAHVGRNLRDPGLDVSDIAGPRRRAASARPAVGRGGRGGGGGGGGGEAGWQGAAQAEGPGCAQGGGGEAGYYYPPPEQLQPQPELPDDPQHPPPLRPALAAPPYATQLPGGGLAAVLSASQGPAPDRRLVQAADLPAATVGKPPPRGAVIRHAAKRAAADAQAALAAEGAEAAAGIRASKDSVVRFWAACRKLDRETCGKVAPADLAAALAHAGIGAAAGAHAGAVAAIARGYQDGAGMVSYRSLARTLLSQTSLGAAAGAAAGAGAAAEGRSSSFSAGVGERPRASSAAPTRPAGSARGSGPGSAGGSPAPAPGSAYGAGAAGGAAEVEAARRSVAWAPEVQGGWGGAGSPAPGSPQPAWAPAPAPRQHSGSGSGAYPQQHSQQQQQQHTQQQPGSITARFQLGGGQQPPGSPRGSPAHPHPQPHPHSHRPASPRGQPPASSASPSRPPAHPQPANGSACPWPPPPAPEPLQKRPTSAIARTSGYPPPREPSDPIYFPFKSNPYWFGGNTGNPAPGTAPQQVPPHPADAAAAAAALSRTGAAAAALAGVSGSAAAAALAAAAREYQPSADPVATLYGKHYTRSQLAGTGDFLTDPVTGAVLGAGTAQHAQQAQRFRPQSARPASGAGAAAAMGYATGGYGGGGQEALQPAEGPPGGSVGASLKGAAAQLYAASRPAPSGPAASGFARPHSAPRARCGGAAEPRVGRSALERQIVREDISVIRSLY